MIDNDNLYYLENGGECADIIRNTNWDSNPLGKSNNWPVTLKNTLAILLPAKFPMLLWWGEDLIQFYNDAYRPSLGIEGKHPTGIGQKAIDCWPEIWDFTYPLISEIKTTGKGVLFEDKLVPIYRDGKLDDVFWTFSYSAVRDENNIIQGVLVVCNETTQSVNYNKNIQESKADLEFTLEAADLGTFDLDARTGKFSANDRLKSWFGLDPEDEIPLQTAIDVIHPDDRKRVTESITKSMNAEFGGNYEEEYLIVNPVTNVVRNVLAKGRVSFDSDENPIKLNGTVQNITETRKANQELLKSRQLTDLTIKSMGMGLFNVEFSTQIIDYTAEFSMIITGQKLQIENLDEFLAYIHPDDLKLRTSAIERGVKTGNFHFIPRVVWHDGSIHRVAISGTQIIDEKGKTTGFSGTAVDVTESETTRLELEEAKAKIEQNKREAQALFRNVSDSSPTGLWLSDKDGLLTFVNKTLAEWTGKSYEDLLGQGWLDSIYENDRQQAADAFSKAIALQTHYDTFFRIRKRNGDLLWTRAAGDPFYDDNGNYAGYSGFCMDVHEIIIGRKALADSESRFSLMIENAPVAICLFTGFEMTIEIANDTMIGYWGRDQSVIGKKLSEALPELEDQPFLTLLQSVYTTGEIFEATSSPAQLLIDGKLQTFYFDFAYTPIRDSKGVVYSVMNVARDITAQVLATQKLEETRIALSGAIELAELATWKLDIESGNTTYSDRFMDWLGLETNTVGKTENAETIPYSHRQIIEDAIQKAIKFDSSGIYDNEYPIVNKNTSQVRIIHASARVFYNADGKPEYLSGTAQDVTKERKLQEELKFKVQERTAELRKVNTELEINNQELQQFAYIASHDLQEPVRKITVFMQMLESYIESDPTRARQYIQKINSATKRMTSLIKDVLGFSQLANTLRLFEPVDLNQIIRHILNDFDLTIEQKEARILYCEMPQIEAINLQMSQLFGNLISNALKYSKQSAPPVIKISWEILSENEKQNFDIEPSDKYYKIEFSDNGIGFEQKYADQIFNIFQRLHGKDDYAGTGIGLAMCRKIVQNHNGEIKAKSTEGIGTTFTVVLPITQNKKQ